MVLEQLNIYMPENIHLDTELTLFIKINSKSRKLRWPWVGWWFFRYKTKEAIYEKIDKLDLTQIKNFCSIKDNIKRIGRQATVWEKTFAKDTADKSLVTHKTQSTLKTQQ